MPSTEEVVTTIKRGDNEELRIGVSEYNSKKFVNLRTWYHVGNNEWRPGKQGLSLRDGEHEEVIKGIMNAATLLKEFQ